MLDPIQIPVLLKAVDFIFEEGRKILEERRERRKQENPPPTPEQPAPASTPESTHVPTHSPSPATLKQELLASQIDTLRWQNHEAEVQHLVRLLEIHTRNHQLAREQYAKWGSALVPPIIMHNLTDAENAMLETLQKLEAVLSKVYDKEIKLNQ